MDNISSSTIVFIVTIAEILASLAARHQRSAFPPLVQAFISDVNPTSISLQILVLNVGALIIWTLFLYPYCFSPLRHLPQPRGINPLGIYGGRAIFGKPPGAQLLKWVESTPNNGLIYFRSFFNQESLILTDTTTLTDVLQRNCYDFEKPRQLRNFLARLQGDGLSVVEGAQHKFQRKSMNPAFHLRQIKNLYPLFWTKSKEFVEALQLEPNPVEMNEWASRVSMDIIGVAALGRDLRTIADPTHPIMEHFKLIFEFSIEGALYFAANMIFPKRAIEWSPFFSKPKHVMGPGVQSLRKISHDLVLEKKREEPTADILSVILRTNAFSDDGLIDQLVTFLAAGHETTANALTWTTHMLAIHPEIQSKLRTEVRAALSAGGEGPTPDHLEALPLLNGVINETLRLFPGAPILLRECVRTTVVKNQVVPKGTQIILCPWAINRSPELWGHNASEFVPQRWINDAGGLAKANNSGGAQSNYAFLTFLQGPRRCIGENFSRAELRCLVAAIVDSFQLQMANPDAEVVPAGIVGLKARDGIHLKLTKIAI